MKVINVATGVLGVFVWGSMLYSSVAVGMNLLSPPQVQVAAVAEFPRTLSLDAHVVNAKAAVVYDPTNGHILFAKNPDQTLPLASLTKLMTAQTVLSLQKDTTLVAISKEDLVPEGDWGFKPGEVWTLKQLLTFGLVASSNDAMAAAAATAGSNVIDAMNQTAQQLGLHQTYFANPTGLDIDVETAGAYGSAHDVALLAAAFLKTNAELFSMTAKPTVTIQSNTAILTATSTDLPLQDIPGLVAAKTGYTDLAGGNLVAVFDIEVGHPIIIVVLGSTHDGRFDDVRTLLGAARATETPTP